MDLYPWRTETVGWDEERQCFVRSFGAQFSGNDPALFSQASAREWYITHFGEADQPGVSSSGNS